MVFTRRWVVELILDLVGYTADRDLAALRLVEPACGQGAFLGPVVERLSKSSRERGRSLLDTAESMRALDLLDGNVELTRTLVRDQLVSDGWGLAEIEAVLPCEPPGQSLKIFFLAADARLQTHAGPH